MEHQDIMKCETVKDCFLWADQQWPGFWKLLTRQPLEEDERQLLQQSSDDTDPIFQKFLRQLSFVARMDQSPEARKLLILGATCMMELEKYQQKEKVQITKKYT